jgi:hypothetical protein
VRIGFRAVGANFADEFFGYGDGFHFVKQGLKPCVLGTKWHD